MKWAPRGGGLALAISGSMLRLAILLLSTTLVPIIAGQFCQVSLPKLGLVRATWRQTFKHPQLPLAAFLGLPYAAPPTGPLRFMPPGAPTKGTRTTTLMEWHLLSGSGRRVEVRSHDRFGPACVNLAHWLTDKEGRKKAQSEDCLLANVFVPVPETKWRQYTSTNRQESMNETSQGFHLWPLPLAAKRLPVIVLFFSDSSMDSQQNMSLSYLELARHAILVTFGYRHGLLGFLPLNSADSASALNTESARSNHAIWDQVALLHWLKHNVIHFGGDPNDISLQAVDNKATQLLQLLALSPMAKGLFRRLILVQDERFRLGNPLASYGSSSPIEARDLRVRLNSALKQTITQLRGEHDKETVSSEVLDFLQTASLTQLAELENQLKQLLPAKVLALAIGPSLDDKHLFPYSSTMARHLELFRPQPTSFGYINYFLYMTYLSSYPTDDELGLLQFARSYVNNNSESQQLATGWYRSSSNLSSSIHEEDGLSYTTKRTQNLSIIISHFEHLRSLNLLVKFLTSNQHSERTFLPVKNKPEMPMPSRLCMSQEVQDLDLQLASFDLLIGYHLKSNSDTTQDLYKYNGTFNNIIQTLLINSTAVRQEMLMWLKFSDLHSAATLASTCDKSFKSVTNIRPNSTFVFIDRQMNDTDESADWIKDAIDRQNLYQYLSSFIQTGTFNTTEWPSYRMLDRNVARFGLADEEFYAMKDQSNLLLDLLPYLSQPPQAWKDHEDLYSCLVELNSTIGKNKANLNDFELHKCVLFKMEKLRATIRQLAHQDLNPILEVLKTNQESSVATRNVALNDNLLMDQEVMNSDSIHVAGSTEVHQSTSKQLEKIANADATGFVSKAINFVKHRPLMVVVTTGLVIFFINISIVLAIAVRTRKRRRIVDSATKPEISIQLPNHEPSSACAIKRLTFELPKESTSELYRPQLMLLEPPEMNNQVPVQNQQGYYIESSFASHSTCSNNSIANLHPNPAITTNILGPIFQSPCTSNDTCNLTPIQNSIFEPNSPYEQKQPSINQFIGSDISEMVLCTTSQESSAEHQNSTDMLILAPYPIDHYFINHQV